MECYENEYYIWKSYSSEINYDLSIRVVFLQEIFYCLIAHLPGEKMKVCLLISNVDVFPIFQKEMASVFRKGFNECI